MSKSLDIFYRYIALCAPFVRLKYNFKAMAYMMPILIFVPLYNIPRFFESKSIVSKKYYCIDYLGTADFTQEDLGIVHHMFSRILNHEIFFVLFFYEVEVFDWDQNRKKWRYNGFYQQNTICSPLYKKNCEKIRRFRICQNMWWARY